MGQKWRCGLTGCVCLHKVPVKVSSGAAVSPEDSAGGGSISKTTHVVVGRIKDLTCCG